MWYPASPVDCTHCRNLHVFVELEETVELSLLCCSGREVHEIRSFTASLVRFTEFLHQVWLTVALSHTTAFIMALLCPEEWLARLPMILLLLFPSSFPEGFSLLCSKICSMLFGISPIFCRFYAF